MTGQCSDSIDKEVEDLLNQGLNRKQIVSKLQNHDKRKVYQSIARVLSLDASDAQLAYELSLFRICSFFLLLVVDDLKNHDPEGVYVMESNPVITRVIVILSTNKRIQSEWKWDCQCGWMFHGWRGNNSGCCSS